MDFRFDMTYAIQTPISTNYTWTAPGEIRLQYVDQGIYRLNEIYAQNDNEFILDMTDSFDQKLFRMTNSDIYFQIV